MRALYDSKSKLDDRGIKALLSETEKYRTWLKVEVALALAQAGGGIHSPGGGPGYRLRPL